MAAFGEQVLVWYAAERVDDAPTLAEMVRDYSGLLFRVAYGVLRNRAEAEDVVQDVFVRVLQQGAKISAVNEPRAWLIRIAWNLALDRRRRVRPEQMEPEFAAALVGKELGPEATLGASRRMERVLAAMDRLPKAERQALVLSALEELSTAEIAAVMERSESSVRSLLFRARARLKERLGKEGLR